MSPAASNEIRIASAPRACWLPACGRIRRYCRLAPDLALVGPAGFRSTFHTFGLPPGGRWIHTCTDRIWHPDHANECRFTEIVAPARRVIEHTSAFWFELALTLAPLTGRRHLHRLAPDVCGRRDLRAPGTCLRPANEQNLDRLAAVLADLVARR